MGIFGIWSGRRRRPDARGIANRSGYVRGLPVSTETMAVFSSICDIYSLPSYTYCPRNRAGFLSLTRIDASERTERLEGRLDDGCACPAMFRFGNVKVQSEHVDLVPFFEPAHVPTDLWLGGEQVACLGA